MEIGRPQKAQQHIGRTFNLTFNSFVISLGESSVLE